MKHLRRLVILIQILKITIPQIIDYYKKVIKYYIDNEEEIARKAENLIRGNYETKERITSELKTFTDKEQREKLDYLRSKFKNG